MSDGFSAVEAILAAVLFGMIVTAVVGIIIYGRSSVANSGNRVRAVHVAEEGVEAVRNISDASFTNLTDGTYGLAQSGNTWTLSGVSDTSDIYTRQLTIATSGTNRKDVTSTVSWPQGNVTLSTSVVTRVTNWAAALVKSWATPIQASTLDLASTNDAIKVATVGDYAYVVRNDGTPDFVVVSIANPSAPTAVGSLSLSGAPTNVFVSGSYAYVTTNDNAAELRIINISNPASPVLTGTYNAAGNGDGRGIYVVGNVAYLSRAANLTSDEFVIVNVANPALPTRLGGYALNVNMNEVYVSGTTAYIATASDTAELLVINTLVPALLSLGTALNLPGTTDALTISGNGNFIFIGQGSTLYTVSVALALLPVQSGSVATSGIVNDVTDNNSTLAFVGTNGATNEFQVINAANFTAPAIFGQVDLNPSVAITGVAYNTSKDRVVGVTASDTQEVMVFAPN